MRKVYLLLRSNLLNNYQYNKGKKIKLFKKIEISGNLFEKVLTLLIFIIMTGSIYFGLKNMFQTKEAFLQGWNTTIASMLLPIIVAVVALNSIFLEMNRVFRPRGNNILNSFPISKFQLYIAELITNLMISFTLPFFALLALGIAFNIGTGFSNLLIIPQIMILSFIISSAVFIVITILTRIIFIAIGKFVSKRVLEVVGTLISTVIIFAFYVTPKDIYGKLLEIEIIKKMKEIFSSIEKYYFLNVNISEYLKVMAFSIILLTILIAIGHIISKIAEELYANMSSTILGKKETKEQILSKSVEKLVGPGKSNSKEKAYEKREWSFLKKNTTVLMQTITPAIIIPLFGLAGFISGLHSEATRLMEGKNNVEIIINEQEKESWNIYKDYTEKGKKHVEDKYVELMSKYGEKLQTEENQNNMKRVMEYIGVREMLSKDNIVKIPKEGLQIKEIPKEGVVGSLFIIAIVAVLSNTIGAVAFSKEKDNINMLKTLPISSLRQLSIKRKVPIKLSLYIFGLYLLIIYILLRDKMFIPETIAAVVISVIFIVNVISLQTLHDLYKQNFKWKNEMELFKNNGKLFIQQILLYTKIAVYIIILSQTSSLGLEGQLAILFVLELIQYIGIKAIESQHAEKLFINIQQV